MYYLPIELEKEILSYLMPFFIHQKQTKGYCLAQTKCKKRCKKKVNFNDTLVCHIHSPAFLYIPIYSDKTAETPTYESY